MKIIDGISIPESILNRNLGLYALKTYNNWVIWKYQERDVGKPTKVPYSPLDGYKCSVSLSQEDKENEKRWSSYERALEAQNIYSANGIGFVVSKNDSIVGVDLDNCVFDGQLNSYAQKCVEKLDSYTELSPSGKGIRIFVTTNEAIENIRTTEVEIYFADRYLTFTGNTIRNVEIREQTESIKKAIKTIQSKPKLKVELVNTNNLVCVESIDTKPIWNKIKNSTSSYTKELFEGKTGFFNPKKPNEDDYSNRDLAVARTLAFYTKGNPILIHQMMLESGFHREKWNKKSWLDYIISTGIAQYHNSKKVKN